MNHDRPRLPSRPPANRAMAATMRLWRLAECSDPAILARVAAGLREKPAPSHDTGPGTH